MAQSKRQMSGGDLLLCEELARRIVPHLPGFPRHIMANRLSDLLPCEGKLNWRIAKGAMRVLWAMSLVWPYKESHGLWYNIFSDEMPEGYRQDLDLCKVPDDWKGVREICKESF